MHEGCTGQLRSFVTVGKRVLSLELDRYAEVQGSWRSDWPVGLAPFVINHRYSKVDDRGREHARYWWLVVRAMLCSGYRASLHARGR